MRASSRSRWSDGVARGVALTVVVLAGCYSWTPVRQESLRAGRVEVRTSRVRFTSPGERVEMVAWRVDPSSVDGYDDDVGEARSVDLSRPWTIEVRRPDRAATAVAIFASTVVGVAAVLGGTALLLFSGIR